MYTFQDLPFCTPKEEICVISALNTADQNCTKPCTGLFADVVHSDRHLESTNDLLIDGHERLRAVISEGELFNPSFNIGFPCSVGSY